MCQSKKCERKRSLKKYSIKLMQWYFRVRRRVFLVGWRGGFIFTALKMNVLDCLIGSIPLVLYQYDTIIVRL